MEFHTFTLEGDFESYKINVTQETYSWIKMLIKSDILMSRHSVLSVTSKTILIKYMQVGDMQRNCAYKRVYVRLIIFTVMIQRHIC